MGKRGISIVAASLLAAISAASAAERDSHPGSGEAPRGAATDMAAAMDDLDRAEPIEAPPFDPAEAGRALVLDEASLLKSFGTATRSAGGVMTTAPAGDAVRQALRSAQAAEAGVGAATAEPRASEGGSTERQVIGADDRIRITDTRRFPYTAIGQLIIDLGEGSIGLCSGTLIGPRTVITAAHCVYDHETATWHDKIRFLPGINGMDDVPYGVYTVASISIFDGFISNYKDSYGSVVPWDIAILTLPDAIGERLGWLGYGDQAGYGAFKANIAGYPADKPRGTAWAATCEVAKETITEKTFTYDCDTAGGSSGSSVYAYFAERQNRMVTGIHVSGNQKFNTAVRLNPANLAWVDGLRK